MTDFLSRLARRAIGLSPAVRPLVPSRYAHDVRALPSAGPALDDQAIGDDSTADRRTTLEDRDTPAVEPVVDGAASPARSVTPPVTVSPPVGTSARRHGDASPRRTDPPRIDVTGEARREHDGPAAAPRSPLADLDHGDQRRTPGSLTGPGMAGTAPSGASPVRPALGAATPLADAQPAPIPRTPSVGANQSVSPVASDAAGLRSGTLDSGAGRSRFGPAPVEEVASPSREPDRFPLVAGHRHPAPPRLRPDDTDGAMPTVPTAPLDHASARAQTEPEAPTAAPATIRVTIGRIEVRAVSPVPPPAAGHAPAGTAAALSLEDYLKQRRGAAR